jgi:26S proteasome regulatory subunit N1
LKKQLAFLLARQKIYLECEDEQLQYCLTNAKLSEHFLGLARELDVMEPKLPADIYKTHLENTR